MWQAIAGPVLGIFDKLISRLIPDPEQQSKARLEMMALLQQGAGDELADRVKVIVAEAQSQSWLTRSWRPLTMLTFVFIVANNYIFAPYMSLFGFPNVVLDVPQDLWDLIKLGLGGYVVGRSGEKIVTALAEAGVIGKGGRA